MALTSNTATPENGDTVDAASTVTIQIQRIRRFWPVVATITLAAVLAAGVYSYTAAPSYTARFILFVSSPGRVPEEDAVMVLGYVDLFNDPAYQSRMRESSELPPGTTFEARMAAASALVYVEATAGSAGEAMDAATSLATNFRWDVDSVRRAEKDASIAALRAQVDVVRESADSGTPSEYSIQRIAELENQINLMQGDSTNQLQVLQPNGGVSVSEPSALRDIPIALLGGLILGSVAAVMTAMFSGRLGTAHDVRVKTGVIPLVDLPRGGSQQANRLRVRRLARLATIFGPGKVPRPGVVAVVAPTATPETGEIARAIAAYWAAEGERVILLRADLRRPSDGDPADSVRPAPAGDPAHRSATVREISLGSLLVNPETPLNRAGFTDVLERVRTRADLVVVQAPPLLEDPGSHSVCAAAGSTVLVLDRARARVASTQESAELLEDAHLAGGVLLTPARRGTRLSREHSPDPVFAAPVRFERVRHLDAVPVRNGHHRNQDAGRLVPGRSGPNP